MEVNGFMSILSQLSSQCGDRTEQSNIKVAFQCLDEPELLKEIQPGLHMEDVFIAGDCAEVMTKVAEERPELILPYAEDLIETLNHKKARVRWESIHAIAFIADRIPDKIGPRLELLDRLVHEDKSVIVRHYGILTLGQYAAAGKEASRRAFPYLERALLAHPHKFAHHAMDGLRQVAFYCPDTREKIKEMAGQFLSHPRAGVRNAAKKLMNSLEKDSY